MPRSSVLAGQFNFAPVGQGLFYRGALRTGQRMFTIVYDCGTLFKEDRLGLTSIIKNLEWHYEHISLLVLSHFDADHVNGLADLLAKRSVDYIILPYLSPIERLLVAAEFPGQDDAFYELLRDPVEFLLRYDVGSIIFIGGRNENQDPITRGNLESDEFVHLKLFPDAELARLLSEDYPGMPSHRVLTSSHHCTVTVGEQWRFQFYNSPARLGRLANFERLVNESIRETPLEVLRNIGEHLPILQEFYQTLWKTINKTSLCLLHGPIDEYLWQVAARSTLPPAGLHVRTDGPYTFLCGDIMLTQSVCSQIPQHFGSNLASVSLASAPHHGSDRSWNRALSGQLAPSVVWVASFGAQNTFGHPGSTFLRDSFMQGQVVLANTKQGEVYATISKTAF